MRSTIVAWVAACSSASPPAASPPPSPPIARRDAAIDARSYSQDEQLAAINKAMNDLHPAAQACWAASAVERFDISGELVATIEIREGGAEIAIARDTTHHAKLVACMKDVLAHYPWAPPLSGQTIQLPFGFRALVDGQNVIDRGLVPWVGQSSIQVATLLDQANSGNSALSLFELAIPRGVATGPRIAERAELWMFLGDATIDSGGARTAVATGDLVFVPAGATRNVTAGADIHAVVAMVPGGREGAARAGALPTREDLAAPGSKLAATVLRRSAAKSYCLGGGTRLPPCPAGSVMIYGEPATLKSNVLAASIIEFPGGSQVAEHVHPNETEVLYVFTGAGTLTVNGNPLNVNERSAIQVPRNTRHAFAATAPVRALQIYTPAGPEQRFKK